MAIEAVVFDMDGVLIDSTEAWYGVRRELVADWGGEWSAEDERDAMGDNSRQWAAAVRAKGVALDDEAMIAAVSERLEERYRRRSPLLPGRARGAPAPLGRRVSAGRRLVVAVPRGRHGPRRFRTRPVCPRPRVFR